MFSSLTPEATSALRAPFTRAAMSSVFHRAWTMAMRRFEPGRGGDISCEDGGGWGYGQTIVILRFAGCFQGLHPDSVDCGKRGCSGCLRPNQAEV